MPIAPGAQVRIADGQLGVTDGPFVEAKEVIGGYAIFEATTELIGSGDKGSPQPH
jgi:hypothetical protein